MPTESSFMVGAAEAVDLGCRLWAMRLSRSMLTPGELHRLLGWLSEDCIGEDVERNESDVGKQTSSSLCSQLHMELYV